MLSKPFNNHREGDPYEYWDRLKERLAADMHEANDDACVDAYWEALQVLKRHYPIFPKPK